MIEEQLKLSEDSNNINLYIVFRQLSLIAETLSEIKVLIEQNTKKNISADDDKKCVHSWKKIGIEKEYEIYICKYCKKSGYHD